MKKLLLRYIVGALVLISPTVTDVRAEVICRYWFDSVTDISKTMTEKFEGKSVRLNIDTSPLPYGLHKINVMVGSTDQWSPVLCRLFYKPAPVMSDISRRLLINIDGAETAEKALPAGSEIIPIDAAKLPTGLHRLDCTVVSSTGETVTSGQRLFYKPAPVTSDISRRLLINIDGVMAAEKALPAGSEIIPIDAAKLPTGLHRLDCTVVSSTGEIVTSGQKLFYKPAPVTSDISRRLLINIDGAMAAEKALPAGNEIFLIDAAKLPTGLHRLDCTVVSSTGETVTSGQKLFYKPAPEMSRKDWEMTFFANGEPVLTEALPEGEEVIVLDVSTAQSGIYQLVCLLSSTKTGESYIAEKKDFYKPCDTPNSITGYVSPAGTEYIGAKVRELEYAIEFENGSAPESAPVSSIELTSVLDPEIYDLSSFMTREIRIGDKCLSLNGKKSFHEKLDLRPERNAIADIRCEFDETSGALTWRIESLDPTTSSASTDKAHSILPANTDGRGMAEVIYDIRLRDNLSDGTIADNTVTITFDDTEIATPTWRNILDISLPTSSIESVEETVGGYEFQISGSDGGSGIWKYELYRKDDTEGTWTCVMTDIVDPHFVYLTEKAASTPQFATVAIDKAGNMEISSVMNSGVESITSDRDEGAGSDKEYYMLNGVKAPEGYKGIKIGKNRKILENN